MAIAAALITSMSGCGSPSPNSHPPVGSPSPVTVQGTESVGWSQLSSTQEELAQYEYVAYLDGVAQLLPDASCPNGVAPTQFDCSARLPQMSAGAHRLQISAVLESNGVRLEGEKSVALDLVVVTRAVAAASNAEAHAATTADDALLAETLATGLDGPSSLAMTPDGRLFIAERSGDVRVWQDRQVLPLAALQASDASPDAEVGLLGLAIHPDFAHNRQVYLAYTARSDNGVLTNRVVRYREVNNIFGQGAVILEDVVTASPVRTPRIQFGP